MGVAASGMKMEKAGDVKKPTRLETVPHLMEMASMVSTKNCIASRGASVVVLTTSMLIAVFSRTASVSIPEYLQIS